MKTVFFDVDTQLDFLYPAGALYVPGAEKIVKSLAELTTYASAKRIPIISTVDAHDEDEPEFKNWKPHCIAGTHGQQKAAATLLKNPLVISTAPDALSALRSEVQSAAQIIIEKRHFDAFANPNLRPLLRLLQPERYVVYGVVSEICVSSAAFGLLETGARVELVTDAVESLDEKQERDFIEQFQARGGQLTTVAAVTV